MAFYSPATCQVASVRGIAKIRQCGPFLVCGSQITFSNSFPIKFTHKYTLGLRRTRIIYPRGEDSQFSTPAALALHSRHTPVQGFHGSLPIAPTEAAACESSHLCARSAQEAGEGICRAEGQIDPAKTHLLKPFHRITQARQGRAGQSRAETRAPLGAVCCSD